MKNHGRIFKKTLSRFKKSTKIKKKKDLEI